MLYAINFKHFTISKKQILFMQITSIKCNILSGKTRIAIDIHKYSTKKKMLQVLTLFVIDAL